MGNLLHWELKATGNYRAREASAPRRLYWLSALKSGALAGDTLTEVSKVDFDIELNVFAAADKVSVHFLRSWVMAASP
jgi:hypothetical protein